GGFVRHMKDRVGRAISARCIWRRLRRQAAFPRPVSDRRPQDSPPIDIVITWLESRDPTSRREWLRFNQKNTDGVDNQKNRYAEFDSLRYLLRSIENYVVGYRKIFIVSSQPLPTWLRQEDARIQRIDHEILFPESHFLPTF